MLGLNRLSEHFGTVSKEVCTPWARSGSIPGPGGALLNVRFKPVELRIVALPSSDVLQPPKIRSKPQTLFKGQLSIRPTLIHYPRRQDGANATRHQSEADLTRDTVETLKGRDLKSHAVE